MRNKGQYDQQSAEEKVHMSTYGIVFLCGQSTSREHLRCPGGSEPANKFSSFFSLAAENVSWWEVLELVALPDQTLHFRRHVDGTIVSPSNVERSDTHVVSSCKVRISFPVVKEETEHTSKIPDHLDGWSMLVIEGE